MARRGTTRNRASLFRYTVSDWLALPET